jgi:protein farnesyltransferase/geranylgeranyltransferase type-1 subunit alpha
LFELKKDLKEEILFLNDKALDHEKNYQIWHHRQLVVDKLGDPTGEPDFIARMFEKDSKNYHVWSYR